jgi:hypothetical protein
MFRSTPVSESHALVAPNLDLVEFTTFYGREDAIIRRYVVKLANGCSWYAPEGREEHTTLQEARDCWKALTSQGWKRRSQTV